MMPPSWHFIRFMLGLRDPFTSDTAAELGLLARVTQRCHCVVEVGVHEGVASRVICQSMDPAGTLYLVDPYYLQTRVERLLRFSMPRLVSQIVVRPWRNQVHFVRKTS